tara:strand:+ start:29 stop:1726 length:1698 start_codon:yes stop_codon:yes gene_type:complete
MSDFWIKTTESGQQQGPFAARQVKQLATTGQLKPDHLVSSDNCATWISAGKFANLEFGALVLEPEVGPEVSPPPGRPLRSRPAATTAGAKISHERREDGESRARKKSRRALIATTCCVVGIAVVGIAIVGFSGTGPGVTGMHPGGDVGQFRLTDVAGGIDTMPPPVADSSEPIASADDETFANEWLKRMEDKYGTKKSSEELPSGDVVSDGPDPKTDDSIQEITLKQLNFVGERYHRKGVKVVGCKFLRLNNLWVTFLPTVRVSTNGLLTTINKSEHEKWLGIWLEDTDGESTNKLFAMKADWADTFIEMTAGQLLNIAGRVVELENAAGYGIIVTDVDVLDLAKEGSSTPTRPPKEQSTAPSEVAAAKQTVVLIPDAAKASGPDDDRLVIKKTAYLKMLKTHLIGRQDKEVVALLGRPPETENGGSWWTYVFHATDSVTGALYNHIQVNFSDDDGRCYQVSIGQTKVVKDAINDSEAAYPRINKSEKLQELRKQLVGQTTENVVARMGKPVEVENGDLFYVFHARDVVSGAVYRHIQVHLNDETGRCNRVSIGHSSVGPRSKRK